MVTLQLGIRMQIFVAWIADDFWAANDAITEFDREHFILTFISSIFHDIQWSTDFFSSIFKTVMLFICYFHYLQNIFSLFIGGNFKYLLRTK